MTSTLLGRLAPLWLIAALLAAAAGCSTLRVDQQRSVTLEEYHRLLGVPLKLVLYYPALDAEERAIAHEKVAEYLSHKGYIVEVENPPAEWDTSKPTWHLASTWLIERREQWVPKDGVLLLLSVRRERRANLESYYETGQHQQARARSSEFWDLYGAPGQDTYTHVKDVIAVAARIALIEARSADPLIAASATARDEPLRTVVKPVLDLLPSNAPPQE